MIGAVGFRCSSMLEPASALARLCSAQLGDTGGGSRESGGERLAAHAGGALSRSWLISRAAELEQPFRLARNAWRLVASKRREQNDTCSERPDHGCSSAAVQPVGKPHRRRGSHGMSGCAGAATCASVAESPSFRASGCTRK